MLYHLKDKDEKFYCSNISNIICEISESKAKAKPFESAEQAQEFKDACEYDLKDFVVKGEQDHA